MRLTKDIVVGPEPVRKNAARFTVHLPQVVKAARVKRGLTQKQLALMVGCPRTFISKLENGKTEPMMGTLTKVADALKTRPSTLLWNAEERAEKEAA